MGKVVTGKILQMIPCQTNDCLYICFIESNENTKEGLRLKQFSVSKRTETWDFGQIYDTTNIIDIAISPKC